MPQIINLAKFELNWPSSCEIIMEEKTPLSHKVVCFKVLDFETSCVRSQNQLKYFTENLLLSQKLCSSKGAVSHNVSYYQQLSIARYQERFYANNYFE